MTVRIHKAVWIATLALWACAAGSPGLAADAQKLLADLRSTYDTTGDLTARFVQTSHLAAAGMDRESQGSVVFQKGGKMRWTYEGSDPQVLVSDGTTLWIHQVRDKTVLRQKLADIPTWNRLALDLLSGLSGVESTFSVGSCGELCLELTPREPRADLARVLVELEPDQKGARKVTTEDSLGNWTRLEFRDTKRNAGVPKDAFVFEPPEGVQVVDVAGAEK